MKVNTRELTDEALAWVVGKFLGYHQMAVTDYGDGEEEVFFRVPVRDANDNVIFGSGDRWKPSTDRDQGFPLIEDALISLRHVPGEGWVAEKSGVEGWGPTMLIAGLRCLMTLEMGEVVDVPEALLKTADHQAQVPPRERG